MARRTAALALAGAVLLLPSALDPTPTDAAFTSDAAAGAAVGSVVLAAPGTLGCTQNYVILVGTSATISWPAPTVTQPNTQYEVTVTQGNNTDSYLVPGEYSTTFSPGLLGLGGLIDFLFTNGTATVSVRTVAIDPATGATTWSSPPSSRSVRVVLPVLGLIGGFFCS
ncbi:hypothetical protein [Mycetocola reblochoni]|uniref:Uncharacterized protein n=1 Tax=Mycetocola reblochoni REB411 TaxID=1255698 RepID=A0A1R4J1Q9_9MICO|nr:hypothetical protein [Mycetocola reblochoni]SJN25665.1 hypothetical protein FM119_04725 [Mycetocola reblochoni REB411]